MRSKINLATQPYEDAQQYLLRWGPVVFLLLLVTIGLVWMTVRNVRSSSDINRQLSQMRSNIGSLDREKASADTMLALPQNHGTVQKSQYLNAIFARKAFSWTTVFSDMEKLMPPGLHVISIAPELDAQNQLQVHIIVGGEKRERAIQLVRNLEQTPRFRNVVLRSDITSQGMTGIRNGSGRALSTTDEDRDVIKFDIVAQYIPSTAGANTSESDASPAQDISMLEGQR